MKILLSSAKTIALFTEAFQVASEATNYSRDGEGMPIKKNAVKITDTIKMYSGFGAAFQAEIYKDENSDFDCYKFNLIVALDDQKHVTRYVALVLNNIEAEKLLIKHNITI